MTNYSLLIGVVWLLSLLAITSTAAPHPSHLQRDRTEPRLRALLLSQRLELQRLLDAHHQQYQALIEQIDAEPNDDEPLPAPFLKLVEPGVITSGDVIRSLYRLRRDVQVERARQLLATIGDQQMFSLMEKISAYRVDDHVKGALGYLLSRRDLNLESARRFALAIIVNAFAKDEHRALVLFNHFFLYDWQREFDLDPMAITRSSLSLLGRIRHGIQATRPLSNGIVHVLKQVGKRFGDDHRDLFETCLTIRRLIHDVGIHPRLELAEFTNDDWLVLISHGFDVQVEVIGAGSLDRVDRQATMQLIDCPRYTIGRSSLLHYASHGWTEVIVAIFDRDHLVWSISAQAILTDDFVSAHPIVGDVHALFLDRLRRQSQPPRMLTEL